MASITRLAVKSVNISKKVLFSHGVYAKRLNRGINEHGFVTYSQKLNPSHHAQFKYPDIPSEIAARNMILHLDDKGRSFLFKELEKYQQENTDERNHVDELHVPRSELRKVFFFNGLPFIGFGILDNMIMIMAGEYIDVTLGAAFGISTMAAAALGNLISDVAGIGSAGYIELLVSKIGIDPPNITPAQALSWKSRWTSALGRALGISFGCLIGMFPLLFIKRREEDSSETASGTAAAEAPVTTSQASQTTSATTS